MVTLPERDPATRRRRFAARPWILPWRGCWPPRQPEPHAAVDRQQPACRGAPGRWPGHRHARHLLRTGSRHFPNHHLDAWCRPGTGCTAHTPGSSAWQHRTHHLGANARTGGDGPARVARRWSAGRYHPAEEQRFGARCERPDQRPEPGGRPMKKICVWPSQVFSATVDSSDKPCSACTPSRKGSTL